MILSTREAKEWVASCRATMLSPDMLEQPTRGRQLMHYLSRTSSLLSLHDVMFARTLGANYGTASDEELEAAFRQWNAAVIACLPPDRLLVFNPSDGWEPLCSFLGVPVPQIPFPHVNRRLDMHTVLQNQLERGRFYDRIITSALRFFKRFTTPFE